MGMLAIRSWVSLPLLFLTSSAGVAALLELVLQWRLTAEVMLSAALLLGFAGALTLLSGGHVRWQARWLRFGYPLVLVTCALSTDGVRLPLLPVLGAGTVAVVLFAVLAFRKERFRMALSPR